MHSAVLLLAGLLAGDVTEYSRALNAKALDQATLDTEGYGRKKAFKREDDGLRITLGPGEAETGWKTPQPLKIGGDFTITAEVVIRKLPKPAQEDGAAVGLAIATQNLDQPDATLVRVIEKDESDVYRPIDQSKTNAPQQPQMVMNIGVGMAPAMEGKPPKPPRRTFPARGSTVRFEIRREGQTVLYQVVDKESDRPRYLGQVTLNTNDLAGVKLFASNRNGAEAVDVLFRSLTIRAAKITGLGTEVRTVFGEVVHGDPTAIEDGKLIVGGPKPAGAASPAATPAAKEPAPSKESAPKESGTATAKEKEKPKNPEKSKETDQGKAEEKGQDKPKGKEKDQAKDEEPDKSKDKGSPSAKDTKDTAAKKPDAASKPPEPKARIPLDEVESITFERSLTLSGRFVGQPNVDVTMSRKEPGKDDSEKPAAEADDVLAPPPGTAAPKKVPKVDPRPNGIRDLHLSLSGLRGSKVKQVTVNCQTKDGAAAWRLDTSDSQDWPLVLRRSGTESWADLFLEPPKGDAHEKDFTVNLTYEDGQSANATIKVTEHTNPKLAYDPDAPATSFDARVYLTGDEQLFGTIDRLGEEALRLRTPWGDRVDVPLAHVIAIYMGLPEHKESPESFARRLKSRGTEDLLLARSKDGEVVAVSGIAEGTEGDKLLFRFQEKTRTLPLKQVEGLVLAARPEPKPPEGLRPTFTLAGGLVVSGRWKALEEKAWKVETAWGQTLNLPASDVQKVRFRGGEMTYLSDLEPARVEETPFFGRRSPWRRDVNLIGGPLKMDGRTYPYGVAVHSRSVLTYDLDGRYASFAALVGFDDAAKGKGRVACRVLADGKELFANPDLRGDAPPIPLELKVAGARRLQLVVDYGPDEDTGDSVIWANARLYRRSPPGSGSGGTATARPAPAKPDRSTKAEGGE